MPTISTNKGTNIKLKKRRIWSLYSLFHNMTEFLLSILWLFLSVPTTTQFVETGSMIDTWSIERQMNFMAEQKEIIIEDYFMFADKIWKIKYARGCAGDYTKPTRSEEKQKRIRCSSNAFDCGWIMKAYGVAKGIISEKEMAWLNSLNLYSLWTPKDARMAERGDFTYRKWFGENETWNMSTHFAVVSRDYTGGNILRVYDNYNWPNKNELGERALRVTCKKGLCYYAGKFRIYIATNGFFDLAMEKWIEVKPFVDPNPLWYSILISWFDYNSDANRRANLRYHWTSGDIRIVRSFKLEASFQTDKDWKHGEKWLCQLLPNRTNNVWINDPRRSSGDYQAQICLEKWLAVPEATKGLIRSTLKINELEKDNIIFIE